MQLDPKTTVVFQLDHRGAANALQQAMEIRSGGVSRDPLGATMRGLAAEILAEALMGAGYVVGVPRAGEEKVR